MDVIHIAHNLARRRREVFRIQAFQKIGMNQPAVNIDHPGFDEAAKLELAAALGDFQSSNLACPIVNILEQVTMNRAKMGKVEIAGGNALTGALKDDFTLDIFKVCGVPNIEAVSEN
jgi:hypothetical protein